MTSSKDSTLLKRIISWRSAKESSQSGTLIFQVTINSDISNFPLKVIDRGNLKYEEFLEILGNIYNFERDSITGLSFIDKDNDQVIVSSDAEFQELLKVAHAFARQNKLCSVSVYNTNLSSSVASSDTEDSFFILTDRKKSGSRRYSINNGEFGSSSDYFIKDSNNRGEMSIRRDSISNEESVSRRDSINSGEFVSRKDIIERGESSCTKNSINNEESNSIRNSIKNVESISREASIETFTAMPEVLISGGIEPVIDTSAQKELCFSAKQSNAGSDITTDLSIEVLDREDCSSQRFEPFVTNQPAFNNAGPPDWFKEYMDNFKKSILLDVTQMIGKGDKDHHDIPEHSFQHGRKESGSEESSLQREIKKLQKKEQKIRHKLLKNKNLSKTYKLTNKLKDVNVRKNSLIASLPEEERLLLKANFLKWKNTPVPLMDAKHIIDENSIEKIVEPEENFTCKWTVQNTGVLPWTKETFLKLEAYNCSNLKPLKDCVQCVPLQPSEIGHIEMEFVAPRETGGPYISTWKFTNLDEDFGEAITTNIYVQRKQKSDDIRIGSSNSDKTDELKEDSFEVVNKISEQNEYSSNGPGVYRIQHKPYPGLGKNSIIIADQTGICSLIKNDYGKTFTSNFNHTSNEIPPPVSFSDAQTQISDSTRHRKRSQENIVGMQDETNNTEDRTSTHKLTRVNLEAGDRVTSGDNTQLLQSEACTRDSHPIFQHNNSMEEYQSNIDVNNIMHQAFSTAQNAAKNIRTPPVFNQSGTQQHNIDINRIINQAFSTAQSVATNFPSQPVYNQSGASPPNVDVQGIMNQAFSTAQSTATNILSQLISNQPNIDVNGTINQAFSSVTNALGTCDLNRLLYQAIFVAQLVVTQLLSNQPNVDVILNHAFLTVQNHVTCLLNSVVSATIVDIKGILNESLCIGQRLVTDLVLRPSVSQERAHQHTDDIIDIICQAFLVAQNVAAGLLNQFASNTQNDGTQNNLNIPTTSKFGQRVSTNSSSTSNATHLESATSGNQQRSARNTQGIDSILALSNDLTKLAVNGTASTSQSTATCQASASKENESAHGVYNKYPQARDISSSKNSSMFKTLDNKCYSVPNRNFPHSHFQSEENDCPHDVYSNYPQARDCSFTTNGVGVSKKSRSKLRFRNKSKNRRLSNRVQDADLKPIYRRSASLVLSDNSDAENRSHSRKSKNKAFKERKNKSCRVFSAETFLNPVVLPNASGHTRHSTTNGPGAQSKLSY